MSLRVFSLELSSTVLNKINAFGENFRALRVLPLPFGEISEPLFWALGQTVASGLDGFLPCLVSLQLQVSLA